MTCTICFETYTNSMRKQIDCSFCKKSACLSCLKTYILMNASAPNCPSCQHALTDDFIDTFFSKHFRRNDLRKQRIQNLLEQEKSLFAETLERYNNETRATRAKNELTTLLNRLSNCTLIARDTTGLQIRNLQLIVQQGQQATPQQATERTVRTMKCPNVECRGYISISNTDRCEQCQTRVCRNCREQYTDKSTHTCNPEILQMIKVLQETCRNCPKCSTPIERISGCSQMFCTICHTAWDWYTQKIINGPIHNPHYFIYQGQLQQQEQNNCEPYARVTSHTQEQELGFCDYRSHAGNDYRMNNVRSNTCTATFCRYNHVYFQIVQAVHYIMDRYRQNYTEFTYDHNTYRGLRLEYLLKQIDEDKLKHRLSVHQSKQIKQRKIYQIYQMFFTVGRDQFQILFRDKNMPTFLTSMENLRVYCVEALQKIYKDYTDSYIHFFDKNWTLSRIYI